jgi:glycosyltransferase involved in cell wall biosynthesis
MARPLITTRNEPVQELLTHEHSAYLIERANPQAIADAIVTLRSDAELRSRLAAGGYEVFKKHCTVKELGIRFKAIMEGMLS